MIDDEDEDDEDEDEEEEEVDPDAPPSPSVSPPPSPTLGTLKSRPTTLNLTTAVSQVSGQMPNTEHRACSRSLQWKHTRVLNLFLLSLFSGFSEQQQQRIPKERKLAGLSTQPSLPR